MRIDFLGPSWNELPLLLTVADVAWLLKIHPNTVYRMIRDGRLSAFKIGRAWRIHRENLLCQNE